jgi:hypothetical protein
MRNRLFALTLAVVFALSQTTPAAFAQATRTDWPALQALSPGEKIVVRTKDGDRLSGRFESANDMLINFTHDGRKVSLDRNNIQRVQLNRGKSRLKGMLVGAAIGGGIGLGVGSVLYLPNRDEIVGTVVPGFAALGAGIGAGVGAGLAKGNKNETIYEAP